MLYDMLYPAELFKTAHKKGSGDKGQGKKIKNGRGE